MKARKHILLGVMATVMAACSGPPQPEPDSGRGGDDAGIDAGACDDTVCLSGSLDGEETTFRAGWWAPFRSGTRWSITGGFTDVEIDVCDYLARNEPIPSPLGFGFFVYNNQDDIDADTLPDPDVYPVIPGWEGAHTEPLGAQALVGVVGGAEATGQRGTFVIRGIDATTLTMDIDVELSTPGDRVQGTITNLQRCDWWRP